MTQLNPVYTQDGWVNPTTGVGGADDKSAGFVFIPGTDRLWSSPLLTELYEVDDIIARIVDALPDAAFERGWRLEEDLEAAQSEATRDAIDKYRIQEQLQRTRRWSRLYGGAALYIGSDDGPQDSPLQFGGNFHFVQPYERDELQPHRYYDDPLSPKFGEPSHYRLTPIRGMTTAPSVIIHESRLVIMHGVDSTNTKRAQNNGWGSSVLIRPMKAVQQFHGAYAIVLSLLADANQNVFKWDGLAELLLRGEEKVFEARMRLMDRMRSTVKGIAVDANGEDFIRSQLNLSGIDTVLDKFAIRMAAAANMPATKLLGQSPAGMNATGESDLRNWNSQTETEQRDVFTPGFERTLRILFRARNGPTAGQEPSTWSIKFNSLWAPTPKEESEIRNLNAQTDQTYVDMQVLTPAHIAKARFTGDTEQQTPLVSTEELAALEATLAAGLGVADDEGVELAPTQQATLITVNEARAQRGLEPWPNAEQGLMSVAEFEATIKAKGTVVGETTGEVESLEEVSDAAPSAALPTAADGAVDEVDTEDDGDTDDTPIDETVQQLAAKMTKHGVRRCEHNIVNRCERCGIERIRDFDVDGEGNPVWRILWRPIGTQGFASPDDTVPTPAVPAESSDSPGSDA